jgi:hypothetical protein
MSYSEDIVSENSSYDVEESSLTDEGDVERVRSSRTSEKTYTAAPAPAVPPQQANNLSGVLSTLTNALGTIFMIILLVVSAILVKRLNNQGIKNYSSYNPTNCRNANHYWQMAVGILVVSGATIVWNIIQIIAHATCCRPVDPNGRPNSGRVGGFLVTGGLWSLLVNVALIVLGGILLEYVREDQYYNYRYNGNTYPAKYQNQSPSNGINRFFFWTFPTQVNEASVDPFGTNNVNNIDYTKCYQSKDFFLAEALGGMSVAFGGFLLLGLLCYTSVGAFFATLAGNARQAGTYGANNGY